MHDSRLLQDLQELRTETAVLQVSTPEDVEGKLRRKIEGLSQDRKKQRNRKLTATIKCAEPEEQGCSQESQGRAEQLAKMLVQMLWHLKAVSVTRSIVPRTKGEEYVRGV